MTSRRYRLVPAEPGKTCQCGEPAFVFDTLNGGNLCIDHTPLEQLPGGRETGGVRIFVHPSEVDPARDRIRR